MVWINNTPEFISSQGNSSSSGLVDQADPLYLSIKIPKIDHNMQSGVYIKDIKSLLETPVQLKPSTNTSFVQQSNPSWFIMPEEEAVILDDNPPEMNPKSSTSLVQQPGPSWLEEVAIILEKNIPKIEPKTSTSFVEQPGPSWCTESENVGVLLEKNK